MITSSWHLLVGGIYQASSKQVLHRFDILDAEKWALVACTRSGVVSIYQKWKEEKEKENNRGWIKCTDC